MGHEVQQMDDKLEGKAENRSASRAQLRALIAQQEYRCALSGIELTPETAELDHVIPVSEGGSHRVENLQVLHRDINRMKGQLSNEEFIRLCCLVSQSVCDATAPYNKPI